MFDPGIFSIGDTVCMPKDDFEYEGIPTFAPEHFARVIQLDSMKRKQFVKGVEQIAQELGIPREEVVFAMDAIVDPVSLYEPVYSDGGDAICVMDQVSDTRNTDEAWTDRIALKEAMKRLDDRERRILSLRFYEGKTQMEVSAEVGISQAQVSRLEKGAINTIKKNI